MTRALAPRSDPGDGPDWRRVHPPIHSVLDALTFRMARLVAVNDLEGTLRFREAYGLSLNEWRVIGVVHALAPVTFGRVRRILVMDKGQLSRVVKVLSDRGLLLTRPGADDARSVDLSLSDAGETLHDAVLEFTAERNEHVVATLTRDECREFMRLLQKLTAHNEMLSELAGVLE